MAERAAAAIARAPKATWLLFAGNLHARKTKAPHAVHAHGRASRRKGRRAHDARRAPRRRQRLGLLLRLGVGVRTEPARVAAPPRPVAVTLARTADGAYDGTLGVGTLTFSPPAAVPMSKLQEAKAKSLERQRAARAAYDAKQFPRCAELYDGVAKELRSANDAYSAACCLALAGKADLAFAALSTAIEYGFVDDHARSRPRTTTSSRCARMPRFATLVARAAPKPKSAK